jgi:hypothetical protein
MLGTGITGAVLWGVAMLGTGITGAVMFGLVTFVTGIGGILVFGVVMFGFGETLDAFPTSTPYFPELKRPNPKIIPTAKTKSPIRPKSIQKNVSHLVFLYMGSESAARSL